MPTPAESLAAILNNTPGVEERTALINSLPLDPGQKLRLAQAALSPEGTSVSAIQGIIGSSDLGGLTFNPADFGLTTGSPSQPNLFPQVPQGLPPSFGVSTTGLGLPSGAGGSPVATGFPLFERTIDLILRADAARRATIDQNVNIIRTLIELERVSPTRAAGMAAGLGLEGPNLSFLNVLRSPGPAFQPRSPFLEGGVGGQSLSLPAALSGQQLSNLVANPTAANIVQDVADFLGSPDIFGQSEAGLIPTSRSLLAQIA